MLRYALRNLESHAMTDMKKVGRKPKNGTAMSAAERMRVCRAAKTTGSFEKPPKPVIEQKAPEPVAAKKPRKQRVDSVTAMVNAMTTAGKKQHLPPAHVRLPPEAMNYWFGIMDTRAVDDWTAPELVVAANLCKLNVTIENEEAVLEHEEHIITGQYGNVIINPRSLFVEKLHSRRLAMMRSLRMGGKAAGPSDTFASGRTLEGRSREVAETVEDSDGLLA